jgi:hypothetical protein
MHRINPNNIMRISQGDGDGGSRLVYHDHEKSAGHAFWDYMRRLSIKGGGLDAYFFAGSIG